MEKSNRIVIARVLGVHGIRGCLKILPMTDFLERFDFAKELKFYRFNKFMGSWKIKDVKQNSAHNYLLIEFFDLTTRNDAEILIGSTVEIEKSERMPLQEGQYWVSDLIGLKAIDDLGTELGVVQDIFNTGASDMFEILDNNGKKHLIPLVEEFFKSADLTNGIVYIHLIDGLWSL